MNQEWTDVIGFHDKFHVRPRMVVPTPLARLPDGTGAERLRHLEEELAELRAAVAEGDLARQADALVDLVYVALGTALMQGLPWPELWAAVHAANMRKTSDPTVAKQVVKPDGWVDPLGEIERLLEARRRRALKEELV